MRVIADSVLAAPIAWGGSASLSARGSGFALLGESLLANAPKGTKRSCPYIRVSLRSTSLVPSRLRGSPRKGHPWPFIGGTPSPLAASMPLSPLRTDSTRPSERGDWRCLLDRASKSTQSALLSSFDSLPALSSLRSVHAISKKAAQQNQPLPSTSDSVPRQEADCRRCAGGREAGRRARSEGTETSLREGAPSPAPGSNAGGRGVLRSKTRMQGWPSFWLLFLGHTRKSDAPCEAQPAVPAEESAASDRAAYATIHHPDLSAARNPSKALCALRGATQSAATITTLTQRISSPLPQPAAPPFASTPRQPHCLPEENTP
jgi:hypothetical protein